MVVGAARRLLILAVFASLVALPSAAHAATPTMDWGYIPLPDGTGLRFTVLRPRATGRFPVAINYGPYFNGSDPAAWSPQTNRFLAEGYAVLGVNVRGTGCSDGKFSLGGPQESKDAVEVIEWAARQPWSNGRQGMFGLSYPGLTQYGPAGLHAPHLAAIAPFQSVTDFYRQGVYPGGIMNPVFAALWGVGLQPLYSVEGSEAALRQGDMRCVRNIAKQQTGGKAFYLEGVPAVTHPYADIPFFTDRNAEKYIRQIRIPVLECVSWQDEMLTSESVQSLDLLDPAKSWVVGVNGYHDECDDQAIWPYLKRFFEHFVKGVDNAFEKSDHVVVFHDATTDLHGSAQVAARHRDSVSMHGVTSHPRWPVAVKPIALNLTSDHRADTRKAATDANHSYVAPLPSAGNENGYFGAWNALWKANAPFGTGLRYTSATLTHDAEFFGPGSADLWITSTGPDAYLQVTISEVRSDRSEVYVQRGWLRAASRQLDPQRSTQLSPYQTHLAKDVKPLRANERTFVRVPIRPLDYVFRAGSRIRVTIDSPSTSGLWGFAPQVVPSVTTVLVGNQNPSRVLLGLLPGARATGPAPACNTLVNQPCRPNMGFLPSGSLDLG